jgi:uncharacterized protein YjbI with pentapeptide repeats
VDFPDLSEPTLELLSTYLRENAKDYGEDDPPADVREIMKILKDHLVTSKTSLASKFKLDVRGAFLRRTDLSYASLRGANLTGADFTNAILRGADLEDAILYQLA